MIKNYLKIALRNLARYKQMTIINILGLAVGMAACILILLFVQYELSYDRYHENADRIYRLSREWRNADGETSLHLGHLAPPFEPLLAEDFPGIIESSARLMNASSAVMTNKETGAQIMMERLFFAEPEALDIFTFPFIEGDPATALTEPNTMVITESEARKYFDDESPVGKTLNLDNAIDLKITGVVKDVPHNSHFHFTALSSFRTLENFVSQEEMENFGSNNYSTFVLLREGYQAANLQAQLPEFIDKHLPGNSEVPASQTNFLHLWPLTDIHLHSHLDSELEANGNIDYVYIYTIIAVFILAIACINFINLTTARATRRAKEVGVRKAMGAEKTSLIRQFLSESVLVSLFALALATLLVTVSLPYFTDFVEKPLKLRYTRKPFSATPSNWNYFAGRGCLG